jgi:hypothetical protein
MPNHFLVKENKEYVDLSDGTMYKPFMLVPYEKAGHGLCEQFGKPVLKKIADDGFNPLLFIAKKNPKDLPNRIRAEYVAANKCRQWWVFEPYEVAELKKGLDDGLSERQIGIKIFAPEEAVTKASFKLLKSVKKLKRNRVRRVVKKGKKVKKDSKISKVVRQRKGTKLKKEMKNKK